MSEIDLKVQFFFNFVANFWDKRAIWTSEKCKGDVLMFQRQIGEISTLSSGKLSLFLILALFFHSSLSKIGHFHPVKNYIFE